MNSSRSVYRLFERFASTLLSFGQDGTINYLTLPAITDGLRFLSAYLPFLPLRLSTLTSYAIGSLARLKHDISGTPVVRILSRTPSRRLRSVGEQSDTGSTISLIFLFVSHHLHLSVL